MPIRKGDGRAELWFRSKEDEEAYDERMIANIQLKSEDFENENFSPVFNRKTSQSFLEKNKNFKDAMSLYAKQSSMTNGQYMVNFKGGKPNHTYFRDFNFQKFLLGVPFAYIFLRELPLKNFYARCFVMAMLYAKYFDNHTGWIPLINNAKMTMAPDPWDHYSTEKQFTVLKRVNEEIRPPGKKNRLSDAESWYNRQPGHMDFTDWKTLMTIPRLFTRRYKEVPWDGTFSQPTMRLANPLHKDTKMVHFV